MPDFQAKNPLHDLHRQAEAEFQNYDSIEIVSTFGEPQAEYGAIRKAAGMIDRPQRACIELAGKDRLSFLNNLVSNQTWDKSRKAGIDAGSGVYAYLLQAKNGRIVTDMTVLELGERTLIELDGRVVAPLLETLERYRFSESVTMKNRAADLHEIALHGPGSRAILEQSLDQPLAASRIDKQLSCASSKLLGHEVIIFRDDACGVPGLHLLVPADRAKEIWMHFLTRFSTGEEVGKRPLRPVGWAAFNTTRIEAGRALFGVDFDDTFVPAETGPIQLARAVSFTKGCYPGQEIVARMHARAQFAKQVVGIRMESSALPIAGAQIMDDQSNIVGAVTSSTISPILSGAAIALAIVKKPHFEAGRTLRIPAEGAIHGAKVVEMPFIDRVLGTAPLPG